MYDSANGNRMNVVFQARSAGNIYEAIRAKLIRGFGDGNTYQG
jgi:hypothetical protein